MGTSQSATKRAVSRAVKPTVMRPAGSSSEAQKAVYSTSEAQQALRVRAGDLRFLGLRQARDAVERGERILQAHVEAVVAAERHAVGADQPDQVEVDALVVADGVVGEAPQVFARQALHVLQL